MEPCAIDGKHGWMQAEALKTAKVVRLRRLERQAQKSHTGSIAPTSTWRHKASRCISAEGGERAGRVARLVDAQTEGAAASQTVTEL